MPRTRNPLTTHVGAIRRALTTIDASVVALLVVLIATAAASAQQQTDELQRASQNLFVALGLREARCPGDASELRPSREVFCGLSSDDPAELERRTDQFFVDLSTSGLSVLPNGSWEQRDTVDSQSYKIAQRFVAISHYTRSGKVVISYPVYYDVCKTQGFSPELEANLQPDKVALPVKKAASTAAPLYPELARKARVQGRVTLHVVIGSDGLVKTICVVSGTGKGYLGFEYAAIQAVKHWHYEPARRDGQPVDFPLKLDVNFTLN